jgi:cytochrome c
MSGTLLNRIVGAFCIAGILAFVVSILGDQLVQPGKHTPAGTVKAGPAVAPQKKPEEQKLDPIGPLLASAKLDAGKRQANKCTACHTLAKGDDAKKLGPPLWNIVGRKAGKLEDYSFSKAMEKMTGAWDYETLNAFIYKPKRYVRGTKMGFAGISKPQDRADLIAYLRTLSDQLAPLP